MSGDVGAVGLPDGDDAGAKDEDGGDEAAGDVDGDAGAVDGNGGCELVVVVAVVKARVRRGASRQRRGLPST